MPSSTASPAEPTTARRWTPLAIAPPRDWSTGAWPLLALVAMATVIRILTINDQSIATDEALTTYEASLPFGAMLHTVIHIETTPPLYFLVIWGWARGFGTGAVALRSVSMLAGIALVPLAYLAARSLFSRRAGLLAAAFVAVNPFMVWYSQQARSYMLLAALSAAAFVFFIRAWREPSRRNLGWWVGFSALALMTHFFAGFAIAPQALLLLWRWRRRGVVLALAAVAAAQGAMLAFAFADASHAGIAWIAVQPKLTRIGQGVLDWNVNQLYRSISVRDGLIGGAVLAAIVTLLVNWRADRATRQGVRLAASIAGFVVLAPLLLSFVGPDYWISRNLIPGFLPLFTVIAAACVNPRARVAGGALALALLSIFAFSTIDVQTNHSLQRSRWREVAASLGPARVPRMVVASGGTTADPLKIYLPGVDWVQPQRRMLVIGEVDVIGQLKTVRLAGDRRPPGASGAGFRAPRHARPLAGLALPQPAAPRGTILLSRRQVATWIVARFRLLHPRRISILRLLAIVDRFYVHPPKSMLVFEQRMIH
ncbi:MAG: glycosyltransferase family 39 protein [Actinomycetota bacterium]|nr:glycosyltransferase family 39 protein [Actinomycetota bacterium]